MPLPRTTIPAIWFASGCFIATLVAWFAGLVPFIPFLLCSLLALLFLPMTANENALFPAFLLTMPSMFTSALMLSLPALSHFFGVFEFLLLLVLLLCGWWLILLSNRKRSFAFRLLVVLLVASVFSLKVALGFALYSVWFALSFKALDFLFALAGLKVKGVFRRLRHKRSLGFSFYRKSLLGVR
jgi:hypothetical protein